MTAAASVESGARLRLFFGLPLPRAASGGVSRWQASALAGAPGVRVVPEEHLHVTLAFLGARPAADVDRLREALRATALAAERPVLRVERYRETQRVAMLVFADEAGRAAAFQARLSERLERLGVYRPEGRPWLAHVTVARFARRPSLRPSLPGLGPVSPSEAALYHSVLRPSGAQYAIVETVALGG